MAYTICDLYGDAKPIRLLMSTRAGDVKVGEPFRPFWWVCDPCNPSSRRFEVTYHSDREPQSYRWFEVVTSDDQQSDIDAKVEHYKGMLRARLSLEAAQAEYQKFAGGN